MRPFPKEQVIEAYQNSPKLVREAFNSEETSNAIGDIRTRYNLHVDTTGTLGENVGYMLIGLLSPSEFFGEMVLSGVDQTTAKGILEALNTRIFIPLRDSIMNPGAAPRKSVSISYQPPGPERPVARPQPLVPVPSVEAKAVPVPIQAPVLEKPIFNVIPEPQIRTMATDMEALTLGHNPIHITPSSVTSNTMMQSSHATPARSFQTASIPVQIQPVVQSVLPAAPPISLSEHSVPGTKPVGIPAIKTTLGSDPYREPIS